MLFRSTAYIQTFSVVVVGCIFAVGDAVIVATCSGDDDGRTAKRRARAREALKLAANFYQQNLVKNSAALEYAVKKRRLNRQTIGDFIVGYAPDQSDALTKALEKRGFSRREMADAGLVNRFGSDLFRGRMMVVLSDGSGEVVGFTGRIIHDDPQ